MCASDPVCTGEPTTIYTAGTDEWHTSWYHVDDRGQFIFSVKACGHAYLALTEYPVWHNFTLCYIRTVLNYN